MICRTGIAPSTTERRVRLFEVSPSDELRQGDICSDWMIPKWQPHTNQIVSDADGVARRTLVDLHGKAGESSSLALCSHDCDLENPRNRRGIIVAPVVDWPNGDMGSDLSLEIIGSRAPNSAGRYAHINLFPVNLGQLGWKVVEFSALTSMISPKKFTDRLLKSKQFEMTDPTRRDFRLKLAAFLARDPGEEGSAEAPQT